MFNQHTAIAFDQFTAAESRLRLRCTAIGEATILDAGIQTTGSLAAGLALARLCLADMAEVRVVPESRAGAPVANAIQVRTDHPLAACLGAQYAGWPVQTDDFFAMGSGPMRMLRGRESVLTDLALTETATESAVGVLEADKYPTLSAIAKLAEECGVAASGLRIAIAPSTSIAGSVQVVARSVETALHKLHALDFDVRSVVSATGIAPLPPPAKPGDTVGGIGRTNDAILYGGHVTLWVDCEDQAIESVVDQVPSGASRDHGKPFAQIFKQYDYDFYQVDPLLFSPAEITFHNLRSGRTHRSGSLQFDVLRQSMLS